MGAVEAVWTMEDTWDQETKMVPSFKRCQAGWQRRAVPWKAWLECFWGVTGGITANTSTWREERRRPQEWCRMCFLPVTSFSHGTLTGAMVQAPWKHRQYRQHPALWTTATLPSSHHSPDSELMLSQSCLSSERDTEAYMTEMAMLVLIHIRKMPSNLKWSCLSSRVLQKPTNQPNKTSAINNHSWPFDFPRHKSTLL